MFESFFTSIIIALFLFAISNSSSKKKTKRQVQSYSKPINKYTAKDTYGGNIDNHDDCDLQNSINNTDRLCPFCGKKVSFTDAVCPHCKHEI